MINITTYSEAHREIWDNFVDSSKNGTFMLGRKYMEYHKEKFTDFSLLFYEDSRLKAILPASKHGSEVRAHGGLTYGGLVYGVDMSVPTMLKCFSALKAFLANEGIRRLIYKRVPHIYHKHPSDEDLYALFVNQASLVRRDVSSCIMLDNRIPFKERRRRSIKKANKEGLIVRKSFDYASYAKILSEVLAERHAAVPVHTAQEIEYLANLHPQNISLFAAYAGTEMLAGTLIYETELVAHTQYLASNDAGRAVGALDFVLNILINDIYCSKKYFDFGISTEGEGKILNEGLNKYKSEFGAHCISYDFYSMVII